MNRTIIAVVTGIWGAATLLAMLWPDPDLPMTFCAFAGAALAGAVLTPLFRKSHPGLTLFSLGLATTVGAALAAPLALSPHDFPQTLGLGPAVVWTSILQSPHVALVWLVGAFATRFTAHSLK